MISLRVEMLTWMRIRVWMTIRPCNQSLLFISITWLLYLIKLAQCMELCKLHQSSSTTILCSTVRKLTVKSRIQMHVTLPSSMTWKWQWSLIGTSSTTTSRPITLLQKPLSILFPSPNSWKTLWEKVKGQWNKQKSKEVWTLSRSKNRTKMAQILTH